jgi:hypothetical protein
VRSATNCARQWYCTIPNSMVAGNLAVVLTLSYLHIYLLLLAMHVELSTAHKT